MKQGFEKYKHHGAEVVVRSDLKGRHREHCLCFQGCKKFKPEGSRGENCERANANYENCVKFNMVLPVWECPEAEF